MIKIPKANNKALSLELTPLIDIIFIVIVFLLLSANVRLLVLPVDVPSTDSIMAAGIQQSDSLTITLKQESPTWAIDSQTFTDWQDFKAHLLTQLNKLPANTLIRIATARDIAVEPLMKVLALLNEQQVTNTQILMQKES
jgi:biopolymer transport protein ExbD